MPQRPQQAFGFLVTDNSPAANVYEWVVVGLTALFAYFGAGEGALVILGILGLLRIPAAIIGLLEKWDSYRTARAVRRAAEERPTAD